MILGTFKGALLKKALFFFIGLVISVYFFRMAFKNVPLHELKTSISQINYYYMFWAVLSVLFSCILRTLRWKILLPHEIKFSTCFHILMAGFSLNCIFPGRLGEVARPVLVAQKTKTSFPGAVSSVLLERLFDLFTLLVLFSFLISWIPIPESMSYTFGKYEFNSALLISLSWWMIKLFCLLLGGVLLLASKRTRKVFAIIISAALKYVCIFPEKIADILTRFLLNPLTMFIHYFVTGIEAIKTPMAFISVMGLSLGTWFVQVFSFLMVARAVPGISLGFVELAFVMVVICFFIAIPSVPGYWGVWEAGGIFAMLVFDIPRSDAAGYQLINHAVQLFPIMVVGFFSVLVIVFGGKSVAPDILRRS
jgi:uncharacterized protein (TIRG00374 family)